MKKGKKQIKKVGKGTKCNTKNPYILDEMKDDDERIGSLVNQGESIKIDSRVKRTSVNESDDTFGK